MLCDRLFQSLTLRFHKKTVLNLFSKVKKIPVKFRIKINLRIVHPRKLELSQK